MYVPPCPHCGSKKTGYIINSFDVFQNNLDVEKIKRLLNGELVELNKFVSDENILFCADCEIQWSGIPEIRYLDNQEIEEEKEKRGITDEYIYLRNNTRAGRALMKSYVKQKKKEEKANRKKAEKQKKEIKTAKVKIKK